VDQTLLVHVVDARTNLDEKVESSVFTQVLFLPDQEEEVAFACKLKS